MSQRYVSLGYVLGCTTFSLVISVKRRSALCRARRLASSSRAAWEKWVGRGGVGRLAEGIGGR